MSRKAVYVVCVFNLYADLPDEPQETAEQRASRKQMYHCVGLSADHADNIARSRFSRSCDHNWTAPVLIGEFATKTDEAGWEVVNAETLTCPHCGNSF